MTDKIQYSLSSACVAMFGTGAGQAIDQNSHVSLATIIAVGAIVFPLSWKLKGWMDKIDARLEAGDERFSRIEKTIADLPCPGKSEPKNCK